MNVLKGLVALLIVGLFAVPVLYWLAPTWILAGVIATERSVAGLKPREIDIPGFRVRYLDSGGSGAPLLLVHGFGGDKDHWTRVTRQLRQDVRVIALDLPGFGQSDSPPDADYRLAAQMERLRTFIAHLGLGHLHLGGSSMGGNLVARYAARHPNEIGSLWLISPSGVGNAPTGKTHNATAPYQGNPLLPHNRADYHDLLNWVMTRPPWIPPRLLDVLADRAVAAHALRAQQFEQLSGAHGEALETVLRGLPIPVHILWGAEDQVLNPAAAEVLLDVLPQASHTVMAGVGHLPMVEAPAATANDYLAFRDGEAFRHGIGKP